MDQIKTRLLQDEVVTPDAPLKVAEPPPLKTEDLEDSQSFIVFWAIGNTILFLLIVLKLMYFMRVSENLAKIVKLSS